MLTMYPVLTILLVLISRTFCSVGLCGKENSVDISRGTHLSNGDVYFNGIKFNKDEYYIDEAGVKNGCLCMKQTCLRKCCPFGSGYNFKKKVCENVTDVFRPPVWDEYKMLKGVDISDHYQFIFGKMNCSTSEVRIRVGQAAPDHHLRVVRNKIKIRICLQHSKKSYNLSVLKIYMVLLILLNTMVNKIDDS